MPYNRNHVRAFMNAGEIELFEASLGTELKSLGMAELKRQLKRARTLRDKSRDLLRRQKIATRSRTGSKLGNSGAANERSVKKAKALDEAVKRYEQALAQRESADARAKRRQAKAGNAGRRTAQARASAPKPTPAAAVLKRALQNKRAAVAAAATDGKPQRRTGPRDGGIQPTPPDVRAEAVESRLHAANLQHIQGHTSTMVRKAQAKRDQRGG